MVNYNGDKIESISITWCIEDVQELDNSLTDQQAGEVLHLAHNNHDANVGINWDTLREFISIYKALENQPVF